MENKVSTRNPKVGGAAALSSIMQINTENRVPIKGANTHAEDLRGQWHGDETQHLL